MLRWIEHQRKKPKHVRTRTAFLVALSATVIVAVLWSVTLPARFTTLSSFAGDAKKELENDPVGLESFFGGTQQGVAEDTSEDISEGQSASVGEILLESTTSGEETNRNAKGSVDSDMVSPDPQPQPVILEIE